MTLTVLGLNVITGERADSVITLPITDSTTLTANDFLEISSGKLIKSITTLSTALEGIAKTTLTSGVYSTTGQQDYMGVIEEGLVKVRGLVEGSGGTYKTAIAVGTKVSFYYSATAGYGQFVVNSTSAVCGTVMQGSVASSGTTDDQWDYVLVQLDFEPAGSGSGAIADGAVTTAKLANSAITGTKIATSGISSSVSLASGVITTAKLANGAITGTKIATGGISSSAYIADGIITNSQITTGTIATAKLANGAITGTKIATGGISSSVYFADSVITSSQIVDRTIASGDIAIGGIQSTNIAIGGVDSTHIAVGGVHSTNLATGVINSSSFISDGVITASQTGQSIVAGLTASRPWLDSGAYIINATESSTSVNFSAALASTASVLLFCQELTKTATRAIPGSLTKTSFAITGTALQTGNWFAWIPNSSK